MNIHPFEYLVQLVAELSGVEEDFAAKEESGILVSMVSRVAFLSDPSHCVVFYPTQALFVDRFNGDLAPYFVRKVLTRGSFLSVEDLQAKVWHVSMITIRRWPGLSSGPDLPEEGFDDFNDRWFSISV